MKLQLITHLMPIALLLGLLQDVHYYHQLVLHTIRMFGHLMRVTGRMYYQMVVTIVLFQIPMMVQILHKLLKVKQCVLITKKDKSNGMLNILVMEIIQLLFVKMDTQ